MAFESSDNIREYLKKIKNVADDKCCMCGKTPDMIRNEYFEYMKNPDAEFEDIGLDELLIMTYKTKRPICAACYFSIKNNADLVKEILTRPDEEIWNIRNDK